MANIALYPGGYKPPHIGHYKAAKIATEQTDKEIRYTRSLRLVRLPFGNRKLERDTKVAQGFFSSTRPP